MRAALVRGADHDAIREFEVADRRALAQEFRIGGDHDVGRRIGLADQPLDLVAGADRHGRFGDHHREARQRRGDLARGAVDVSSRSAWPSPRRDGVPTAMKTASASATGAVRVGGEIQPLGLHVGRHQRVEPGLEDRDLAPAQRVDLAGILVHAGDLVTEIGKAGARYQPT